MGYAVRDQDTGIDASPGAHRKGVMVGWEDAVSAASADQYYNDWYCNAGHGHHPAGTPTFYNTSLESAWSRLAHTIENRHVQHPEIRTHRQHYRLDRRAHHVVCSEPARGKVGQT